MARLTHVLIILFCVVFSYAQSSSELFEEVNNLYSQGKKTEGKALFVRATELLLVDSAASPTDKIAASITSFTIAPFQKQRGFLLQAISIAQEYNLQYLLYDNIEQIKTFYYQLSFSQPGLYDSIRAPGYRYEYVRIRTFSIDTVSNEEYHIKVYVNKALGFTAKYFYIEATINGEQELYDASLLVQNDTFSTFKVMANEDFKGFGEQCNLVSRCKLPEFDDKIEDLFILRSIQFTGNSKEELHSLALLLTTDYHLIKPIFDQYYIDQILEVYESYKGDSVLKTIASSGAFKEQSIEETFKNTTYADLQLFFDFVQNFPSLYYGKNWRISEVFATWLINDAPLSPRLLSNILIREDDKQDSLILHFEKEIYENQLFVFWQEESNRFENEFSFQDVIRYQKIRLRTAQLLGQTNEAYSAALKISEMYSELNHSQAAVKYLAIANGSNLTDIQLNEITAKTEDKQLNIVVQNNHTMPYELVFHPNGRYYYTAAWDGKIKVWDANQNKLIKEYAAHLDMIRALNISANGKYLVTGDEAGLINIWEIANSSLSLAASYQHKYSINEVHFSTTKGVPFIAFCGGSKKVWLYNWELNKTKTLNKHTKDVSALCFDPKGTFLYSGGRDSLVYKWPIYDLVENWDAKIEWDHWYREKGQIFQIAISNNNQFFTMLTSDSSITIWDISAGKRTGYVDVYMYRGFKSIFYTPATFSPDNKLLVYADSENNLRLLDMSKLKSQWFNHGMGQLISDVDFHPNGKILATTGYVNGKTKFWDLTHFDISGSNTISTRTPTFTSTKAYELNFDSIGNKLSCLLSTPSGPILTSINLTNGESRMVNDGVYYVGTKHVYNNAYINWYGEEALTILHTASPPTRYSEGLMDIDDYKYLVDEDEQILYMFNTDSVSTLIAYDLLNKKQLYKKQLEIDSVNEWRASLIKLKETLYLTNQTKQIFRYNATTGSTLKPLKRGRFNHIYLIEGVNQKHLAICNKWNIELYNVETQKVVWKYRYRKWKERDYGEIVTRFKVSEDGRYLALGNLDYDMLLIDMLNAKSIVYVDSASNWFINGIAFHPTKPILVFANEENKIRIIDFDQKKVIVDLYPQTTGSFIWINENKQYWAKKADLENIAFEINGKVYPAEQFDVNYNRPDKVLAEIPIANLSFLNALKLATEKRLGNQAASSFDITSFPNINFINKTNLPVVTTDTLVSLKIEAFDYEQQLSKLFVAINGVEVMRLSLTGKEFDSIVTVPLGKGGNSIKLWVENDLGLTSLKEGTRIQHNGDPKSNLYLFALSVSEYEDKKYNLKYAVKDGRDIVNTFLNNETKFDSIFIDTFFNEQVTENALDRIAERLKSATINDQVILFISGHGLLDKNYDFYFAGHHCNFQNPQEGGIAYAAIESTLSNSVVRKRLLLMDACHSGEVDKDAIFTRDTSFVLADGAKSGVTSYSYRGVGVEDTEGELGLNNSFELMKELFSDFNSQGTQVISAAAGNSYALESEEWANGVFTYSLLKGLREKEADLSDGGEISVSELREYVSKKVFELTNGQQKPTSREENIEFDFTVW